MGQVRVLWLRAFEVCTVVDTMLEKKQKKIDDVLGETSTTLSSTTPITSFNITISLCCFLRNDILNWLEFPI